MIGVRDLASLAEYNEAVGLQRAIWGWQDLDLLPVRFFVVARSVGGQALGAFDGDRMIGFCLAIPGVKPEGSVYLHSHMLGVLEEYRNRGVGRRLKFAQRDDALRRNIDLVEWTFDPLEIKNAYFNIECLGAVIRRFIPNQYGVTTSALQAGLPTDRCVAEWRLRRERARLPVTARIAVPANIGTIKKSDPASAREIQLRVARKFQEHFAKNLAVVGFEPSSDAGTYLLGPWDSK